MAVLTVPMRVRVLSIYQFGRLGKFLRYNVKTAVRHALELVCDFLPDPTKKNTYWNNSHTLIDLMDEFLANEVVESTRKTFKGLFKMAIIVYDFDTYYKERIDWMVKRIKEIDWEVSKNHENPRENWWLENDGHDPEKMWEEELVAVRKEKEIQQGSNLEKTKRLKVIENMLLQNRVVKNEKC